jgi:predicted transcriptional regulator of viral defense system
MRAQVVGPDVAIARIAARQHGVVTVAQLLAAGVSATTIGRGEKAGRLHRIHRGIYAVGHPGLNDRRRWKAASSRVGMAAR